MRVRRESAHDRGHAVEERRRVSLCSYTPRVRRAALFALVGVAFFGHWLLADPSFEVSDSQSEWKYVLGFSAAILALAFALPVFGRLAGGRWVFRLSLLAGAGAALGSLANILEDGLQMGWAFFGFILGTAIIELSLLALTVVMTLTGRGGYRLLALIPAATAAAIVLYVIAGGILMLATWLAAAALALALPTRTAPQAAPTTA